ncbi:MAG TPA: DUF1566 domain-containing protein [Candidatus Paceibacterota bacterium]|nr:DUF1566 domain-containing protein [Candidatus Paceibacterota bacterium]
MKKILKIVPYLVIAVLVGVTVTYAGSLTPPGAPAKTMKSLSDLYELVNTGDNIPSTNFTTPGTIASSMNSIESIYDLLTNKISAIDGSKILTGTTIFGVPGTATGAPVAPTFASADETTYQCEYLAADLTQPVDLETICGANSCTWTGSACVGGIRTPIDIYTTWYAAKAACAGSTAEGQIPGTWRLPTVKELFNHYQENNIIGGTPEEFQPSEYWSDSALPGGAGNAYNVAMYNGGVFLGGKSGTNGYIHCVR